VDVAAYVHIRRTYHRRTQTGVGKHIDQMVPRLANAPGVNLRVLADRRDLTAAGAIPDDSSLAGLPCVGLPGRRWLEAAWVLADRPKVERWAGRCDWVYCPAEAYVSRRGRLAVTVHCATWVEPGPEWADDPFTRRGRWAMVRRLRRLRRADLVLTVSDFLRRRLIELVGISADRTVVVGNGVEDDYYTPGELPAELAQAVAGRPYAVVVGGLAPHKGVTELLAVADELARRRSPVVILVAGVSADDYRREATARDNVVQLGYVGVYTGLPALLHRSVALLLLSRYETFGIPAAEAMAAGTPAVVAHHAGLPEIAGDAGIVVDPSNVAAVADVVERLAADKAERALVVDRGRKRAEQFRWDACAARLCAALRQRT